MPEYGTGGGGKLLSSHNPAELLPLLIGGDGKDTPTVIALTAVTSMGKGGGMVVASWFWIFAIHGHLQVAHAQSIGSGLGLGQIDGDSLLSDPTTKQCGHQQRGSQNETQMIRVNSLAANGTRLIGVVPQIGHAGVWDGGRRQAPLVP